MEYGEDSKKEIELYLTEKTKGMEITSVTLEESEDLAETERLVIHLNNGKSIYVGYDWLYCLVVK